MRKHCGWIALDIDGTITDETHRVPKEVIAYLHSLQEEGWELVFITGRTFSFAYRVMQAFDFEYYLAVQNGADILQMPSRKLVAQHYLDPRTIAILDDAYRDQEEDFLVYAGYAQGDFCFYRPQRFSPHLLAHLQLMMTLSPEPWQAVADFQFSSALSFPLVKCLGTLAAMQKIDRALCAISHVATSIIKDPLSESIYLNLVTSSLATKGKALRTIQKILGKQGPVIAAGDDLNDLSMLQEADVKIVMGSAPQSMHAIADILAKPGSEQGIINALKEAMSNI